MRHGTPTPPARDLHGALSGGRFAVVCELIPPRGHAPETIVDTADLLRDRCDAVLATDNAYARVATASVATAGTLVRLGLDAVAGLTCRDRNRIALQADALGAALLGIRTLLCLTGDHTSLGNEPGSSPVFDLDGVQLLMVLRAMRDEGRLLGGAALTGALPSLLLGAAAHLDGPDPSRQLERAASKVAAGADLLITQTIFDLATVERAVARYRTAELHRQAHLLIAVAPPTPDLVALITAGGVPGTTLPAGLARRLRLAKDPIAESVAACAELVAVLPSIPGVAGVYIGAPGGAVRQRQVIARAGLDGSTPRSDAAPLVRPAPARWAATPSPLAAACPKRMGNGPCGGVRPDGGCEVAPHQPCVWMAASAEAPPALVGGARAIAPPVDPGP